LKMPHPHPVVGSLSRRRQLARNPRKIPLTRSSDVSISTVVRLSLTELQPHARARPARLLPLDAPRIARQQSLLPQLLPVPFVRPAQPPRDRQAPRPPLPRHPPTPPQRPRV